MPGVSHSFRGVSLIRIPAARARARREKPKAYTGFYIVTKKSGRKTPHSVRRALSSALGSVSSLSGSVTVWCQSVQPPPSSSVPPHTHGRSIDLYNYIDLYIEKDTGTRGPDWMVSFTPLVDQHDVPAELRSEWRLQLS